VFGKKNRSENCSGVVIEHPGFRANILKRDMSESAFPHSLGDNAHPPIVSSSASTAKKSVQFCGKNVTLHHI
jgi:hypothetical protein